jgi:hypothetical protein
VVAVEMGMVGGGLRWGSREGYGGDGIGGSHYVRNSNRRHGSKMGAKAIVSNLEK